MRRICCAVFAAIAAAGCIWISYASGGTAADPVVTESYINDTWLPEFMDSVRSAANKAFRKIDTDSGFSDVSKRITYEFSNAARIKNIADRVLGELQRKSERFMFNNPYLSGVDAAYDDVYAGTAGTMIILNRGSAEVYTGSLIDITKGIEIKKTAKLSQNTAYLCPENGAEVRVVSDSAGLLIEGKFGKSSVRHLPQNYDMAYALYEMGLVRGAAKGMELARVNTRAESVTMLIRLLAEEDNALSREYSHPFKDIDAWAQKYIGYAYKMGYANGVALDRFDAGGATTANHYMTFILRALGYDDLKGDFKWGSAMDSAVKFGVITAAERDYIMGGRFLRDHMIYLSYRALNAKLARSNKTLLEKLIDSGAINRKTAENAMSMVKR